MQTQLSQRKKAKNHKEIFFNYEAQGVLQVRVYVKEKVEMGLAIILVTATMESGQQEFVIQLHGSVYRNYGPHVCSVNIDIERHVLSLTEATNMRVVECVTPTFA